MNATANEPQPILSICIPTYNRAGLLRSALETLSREALPYAPDVEVVVCDNASSDATPAVIAEFIGRPGFRHARNDANIGAAANVVRLVQELAYGKYIWVLGDDDLVVKGSVKRLLAIIAEHPGVEALFLNHSYLPMERRSEFASAMAEGSPKVPGSPLCTLLENRMIDRWEDVIGFTRMPGAYTSIVCHLATAEVWRRVKIQPSTTEVFANFETTFPHLAILAPTLTGRPIYYVGEPQVIMLIGNQEWFDEYWARLLFTHVLEFSRILKKSGASRTLAKVYRDHVFEGSPDSLWQVMSGKQAVGWKLVFFGKLVCRYWSQRSFRRMVFAKAKNTVRGWLAAFRNRRTGHRGI